MVAQGASGSDKLPGSNAYRARILFSSEWHATSGCSASSVPGPSACLSIGFSPTHSCDATPSSVLGTSSCLEIQWVCRLVLEHEILPESPEDERRYDFRSSCRCIRARCPSPGHGTRGTPPPASASCLYPSHLIRWAVFDDDLLLVDLVFYIEILNFDMLRSLRTTRFSVCFK